MLGKTRALYEERTNLRNELLAHAQRTSNRELREWLRQEMREFILSVKAMSKAKERAIEAHDREITDPEEFAEYLKYTNQLEQLAIQEAALHAAYLERIIARMKAKKKELGLT